MKNSVEISEVMYCNEDASLNNKTAKDVEDLYRLVAGFEIINQIHKRKLEGLNYKYGNNLKTRLDDEQINELYCKDKIYWDFAIREKGNELNLGYKLDVYGSQADYVNSNVRYSIYFTESMYTVFEVMNKRKECVYKSEDIISIINWIITKNNLYNKDKRDYFLNNLDVSDELKFKLTQPYVNDIGLDVMIALSGGGIKFELMNKLIQFKELYQSNDDVKSVDCLIDAGVDLEVSIVIVYNDGSNKVLKFNNESKINGYLNIYEYLDINNVEDDKDGNNIKKKLNRVIKLIKKSNLTEKGLSNTELMFKEGYLGVVDYTDYGELIIKMCEYDLLIKIDELGSYSINKAVLLSGVPVSIFEINKILCEKELVKWLFLMKKADIENFDYLSF